MAKKHELEPPLEEHVLIWKSEPGYEVAKGIKEHSRICKRLSACTCVRAEQGDKREACFDWVKV